MTLSSAVMCGNRLKAWNTMPIRERMRAISRGGCATDLAVAPISRKAGRPSIRISPASGTSSQFRQRRKVDLPEPDGPMMQTTSPRATLRLTPLITSSAPNDLRISIASTIGSAVMPGASPVALAGAPFQPVDETGRGEADREVEEADQRCRA